MEDMKEVQIRIGNRISKRRKEKGLYAKDLAAMLDVTKSYMSKVENGHTLPNIELLNKLSDVLDVPMGYFLDEFKHEPNEELREDGVEWIYFGKELEEQGMSMEEIKRIVNFYKLTKDVR